MAEAKQVQQHPRGFMQVLFILFIGVFTALFIGFGLESFYPVPSYPACNYSEYMPTAPVGGVVASPAPFVQSPAQDSCTLTGQNFQSALTKHSHITTIIIMILAIILVVLSLTLLAKIFLIADGILLGAMLALLYGIILGAAMGDNSPKIDFALIGTGLVLSILVVYLKFIKLPKAREDAA